MKPSATQFDGVFVFDAEPNRDERGYFARVFDRDALETAGCTADFVQWSVAFNERAGTLRGLHFNAPAHEEAKLVRVVAGAIYDLLVDLRPRSRTFATWASFELREGAGTSLYVPAGFAHGYQTLVERTYIAYGISRPYVESAARGINPLDPALGIEWPLPVSAISERDRALPTFADYLEGEGRISWSR